MVYCILGDGFEEAEAIIPCDLLRRAGVRVQFAGIGGLYITGGHGITVTADCLVEEIDNAQMLIAPGGLCGVESIRGSSAAMDALRRGYASGCYVAAICAAPTLLPLLGISQGKRVTCYPGMESALAQSEVCSDAAVRCDRLITGKAAGTAFDFALLLVETLCGRETAQKIRQDIFYRADEMEGKHV